MLQPDVVDGSPRGVITGLPSEVARRIFTQLNCNDREALRLVSRGVRAAASACFTAAQLTTSTPPLQNDLLEAFPELRELRAFCESPSPSDGELQQLVDRAEAASPLLLGRVTSLYLETDLWDAPAVQALGTRCTSLETFKLFAPYLRATFRGTGATPAEQHAHLRCHLATRAPVPTLVHPLSPVGAACLTDLTLDLTRAHNDLRLHPDRPLHTLVKPLDPDSPATPLAYDLLRALHHLAALTCLTFRGDVDCDHNFDTSRWYSAILETLPHLPQLRHLGLLGEWGMEYTPQQYHLAPLTRLTHFTHNSGLMDTQHLSHLVNLQHLEVTHRENDVTHLYALTALTALSFGQDVEREDGWEAEDSYPGDCTLTPALPNGWRTGLVDLVWEDCGQVDAAALGLLTALTSLRINYQRVTADLVWALVKMPHLHHLTTSYMSPDRDWSQAIAPPEERPTLPPLQELSLHSEDCIVLNALACLTRLPPGKESVVQAMVGKCCATLQAPASMLQHWSRCWLHAMLCDRDPQRCFRLLFLAQADVDSFCAVAGRIARDSGQRVAPQLMLYTWLPPGVLPQLAAAASNECRDAKLLEWE